VRAVRIPGRAPNSILAGTYPGDGATSHAAHSADKAIELLDGLAVEDAPWLLRVSIDTPHTPVLPPEPFASMYAEEFAGRQFDEGEIARRTPLLTRWRRMRGFDRLTLDQQRRSRTAYTGMVSYLDSQLARVEAELARRGLDENLLTVLIADHGSAIGDHGLQVKGPFNTDDISRVPFMVRWPGRIEPGACGGLVQTIDVLPTLAELLGRDCPQPCSGRSLLPALEGSAEPIHEAVFATGTLPTIMEGRREAVHTPDWLYVRYPQIDERELFDLRADPRQTRNVSEDHPAVRAELDARLDEWDARHGRRVPVC